MSLQSEFFSLSPCIFPCNSKMFPHIWCCMCVLCFLLDNKKNTLISSSCEDYSLKIKKIVSSKERLSTTLICHFISKGDIQFNKNSIISTCNCTFYEIVFIVSLKNQWLAFFIIFFLLWEEESKRNNTKSNQSAAEY